MTSFFSAEVGPIWIKFCRLVQNDMSTAVIWSKSKPDVEFQYGRRLGEFHGMSSQSHLPHCRMLPPGKFNVMIPELCVTLQGAVTWRNQCHDRATLQGVIIPSSILKIVFRHILFIFVFLMQFGLWRAAACISSPIHLYSYRQNFGYVKIFPLGGVQGAQGQEPDLHRILHFSGISGEVMDGFRWNFMHRRLLKNACIDLHEMLRVDRCRDMDEPD